MIVEHHYLVDPECFRGTTYKVSGWSELGPTSGFGRHAQGTELVSAIGGQTGRWLGTVRVADKCNEIPAAQTHIDRLDLDGKLVVLDALPTQDLTAQKLHFERGADYVMTVKANQKGLYQNLETKLQTQFFSPSADAGHASLPA